MVSRNTANTNNQLREPDSWELLDSFCSWQFFCQSNERAARAANNVIGASVKWYGCGGSHCIEGLREGASSHLDK